MPMIPLSEIQDSGENVRRIGAGAAADAGLRASIATLGVLVPVLLRPAQDGGYIVLEGRRRIAAARTLNLTEIPAEISQANPDIPDDAISAATNMVRAPMHPVDQWHVVQQLQAEHGYSVNGAAEALGLSAREARRMALLAKLHPPIIEAIVASRKMPEEDDLRDIANADPEAQAEAWKALPESAKAGEADWLWSELACMLEAKRYSKDFAEFDDALAAKHGVVWEEDLFAQPRPQGPELFTRNLAGFLAAQQDWIETVQVPGLIAQGYQAQAAKLTKTGAPRDLPDCERVWSDPKKAPKTVIRSFWVDRHTGRIRCDLWKRVKPAQGTEPPAAEAPRAKGKTSPAPAPAATTASLGGSDPIPLPTTPAEPGRVLTKAGARLVAEAKTRAVHALLREARHQTLGTDWQTTLHALLVALASGNVRVTRGSGRDSRHVYFEDLVGRLVTPEGGPRDISPVALLTAAREALSSILMADAKGEHLGGSGEVFDWCARILGAPLARFDTAEILAETSTATLRSLAQEVGVKPSLKAAELRRELAGKLPTWCPPGGSYADSPGPELDDLPAERERAA